MKNRVRVLLIGDQGVGKSSLISSYISRHFPQEVPPVLTDAIIPAETTANNVCVVLTDSSARSGDREILKQKILMSDSIIALYDVSRPESLDGLIQKWLPLINDIDDKTRPVVVVGNKTDLLEEAEEDLERLHLLLKRFPFVLLCLRCSAAKIQDIDQVFFHSELNVTFPLQPMFDTATDEFTPACRRAFLRIFRILDLDGDNLLSDAELCETQYKCFDSSISMDELVNIKNQIAKNTNVGLYESKVTFEGFLELIRAEIHLHKFQIPWTILRRFDYDDDLNIMVS